MEASYHPIPCLGRDRGRWALGEGDQALDHAGAQDFHAGTLPLDYLVVEKNCDVENVSVFSYMFFGNCLYLELRQHSIAVGCAAAVGQQ